MATRRRTTSTRRPASRSRRRSSGYQLPTFSVPPEVARSLFGLTLLVFGVVTLIMLFLPAGQGTLTMLARNAVVPFFGSGRWLLPFLLIGAGAYVEWGGPPGPGWQWRLVAATAAYIALLGLLEFIPERGGGRIGTFFAGGLRAALGDPIALVLIVAIGVAGVVIALQKPVRTLVEPFARPIRGVGAALSASPASAPRGLKPVLGLGGPDRDREGREAAGAGARRRGATVSTASSPGQVGVWGEGNGNGNGHGDGNGFGGVRPDIPIPVPSPSPMSSTFAPPMSGPATTAAQVPVVARPPVVPRDPDDVTDQGDGAPVGEEPPYSLPPVTLLDDIAARKGGSTMDHERNAAIIVGKLASFNIPARVTRWNAGPVVTQYEVEPDPSVKVSRIEGLADDLAMALAARTIRIEAPIPGKSVVGLEIPNSDFNVVALRRILEEVDFKAAGSRLTFALGRDVAGHARAADLAKMPHLLIAGATGSGKSVMVNALITSLLCEATPDDVRMILMDLKRVELAAYNGLPHLLVPVITEPERAKAALKWAVGEMENRYRKFAGATARNIVAYNESRVDPADRMPYLVIVIDELADLMMREGKNIEDPIVRLAQKARATGIHMVLATQRPSVNVVTGLIKANFPSRIAFAMASQIDSRTILDAPGAEDLIGRGDMLFQPADLPRPIRLQGVFVSDKEIGRITEFWKTWKEHYDLGIIESDEEGTGSLDDLADEEADRLLPEAVEVIREYDRASASLLQRRLKIGYARAARIIDQLEARGYIGAFDGSNARQVLRRDEGLGGVPDRLDGDED